MSLVCCHSNQESTWWHTDLDVVDHQANMWHSLDHLEYMSYMWDDKLKMEIRKYISISQYNHACVLKV